MPAHEDSLRQAIIDRLKFAAKGTVLSALILVPGWFFFQTHFIGIDTQAVTCLPYHLYIINRKNLVPTKGQIVSFRMDSRAEPYFKVGQLFVKRVYGVPGDAVNVTLAGVFINGKKVKSLSPHVLKHMHEKPENFVRRLVLKPGQYWVMGTHPWSFDSTYWGVLYSSQIVGTGMAL